MADQQRAVARPHLVQPQWLFGLVQHRETERRERQRKAGLSAVVFYRRHPELGSFLGLGPEGPPKLPSAGLHRWRRRLARALQFFGARAPGLWEEILRYHYIQGLQRGWSDPILGRPQGVGGERR